MFPLENGSPDSNHFDEDEDSILDNDNEVLETYHSRQENAENGEEAAEEDVNGEAAAALVSANSPSATKALDEDTVTTNSNEDDPHFLNNSDLFNSSNLNFDLNVTAESVDKEENNADENNCCPRVYLNASSSPQQSEPERTCFNYLEDALQSLKMQQRPSPPPVIIHENRDILDLGANITGNWGFTPSTAPMTQSLDFYVFGERTTSVRSSNIRKQQLLQLQQQHLHYQQQQFLQQQERRMNGGNGFKRYPHNHR